MKIPHRLRKAWTIINQAQVTNETRRVLAGLAQSHFESQAVTLLVYRCTYGSKYVVRMLRLRDVAKSFLRAGKKALRTI